MADQSLMSRIGTALLPLAAKRVFPAEWIEAGDDRDKLLAVAKKRRKGDGPRPDALLQRSWGRASTEIEGRNLHLLTPKAGSTGQVFFYCHGGAFVVGPSSLEWLFAARVANALSCDLALFDYAKVPEVDSSTIRRTTLAAYDTIEQRYGAPNMIIGGTSAGGGLAMSTLLQLQLDQRALPSASLLISPWLDMTVSHPDAASLASSDRLLPATILRRDGELYAGASDLRDPLVSPRFLDASQAAGLPPMAVTAGELEILLPEAQELVENARAAGVRAQLMVEPNGQHAAVLAPTREAKTIMAECVEFVRHNRRWD